MSMASRVSELSSAAADMSEESAETEDGNPGSLGQKMEAPLPDSDPSSSVPSNVLQVPTMPGWDGSAAQSELKGRRRILIVDDELAIADTLQLIFQMQRYDARVAYSAESAAELISQWQPELAVLDVILPEMNGVDLAVVIKANYPKCHIILFSGHTNTSVLLEEANRKGHTFEVLAKPVMPDVMLQRASELLGPPDGPAYD
jgi:CheY-like chemotaxis protein